MQLYRQYMHNNNMVLTCSLVNNDFKVAAAAGATFYFKLK